MCGVTLGRDQDASTGKSPDAHATPVHLDGNGTVGRRGGNSSGTSRRQRRLFQEVKEAW